MLSMNKIRLATLNMARMGLLGEIIHTEGAYIHDLREAKYHGYYKHWRLEYSKYHTGNPYPTHGLGPIAQIMGINQGDRMEYLSSVSTNQFGLALWAKENLKDDERMTLSERYMLGRYEYHYHSYGYGKKHNDSARYYFSTPLFSNSLGTRNKRDGREISR